MLVRLMDKSLMVIPNKLVAADTITNLSRFTRRRIEQVIGLTYSSKPEQVEEFVPAIRDLIRARPEVDRDSVVVFFRDFGPSSLDIVVVYELPDPDFLKSVIVKQELNLAIMRAVAARGLSMAFPTQTIELTGAALEKIAARRAGEPPPAA